ncbi:hypothetical protein [Thermospira aquatica]|uniref:Lipoprotein n=1 Tax=Thermospira aquatica TaxID=2828656 RepID=A0AAX3BAR4_9SPIR|nr:hypothetical protein [Thermospira aquatica]URA09350.1 hypothetical protein KDW03_07595 [Thermospira aquatica]
MKRSVWFLMTLVAVTLMVVSCGGKKPEPAPQPQQPVSPEADALRIKVYTIQASEEPKPKWVNKRWYIGKDEEGVKTIYLTVSAQAVRKDNAARLAEAEKIAKLTEAIKQVATREFALARAGMLDPDSDKALETYFEETIAAVSKNVNISGAMNVADYWEYVQEVQGGESKTYYIYYKQYAMPYALFEKARKDAWDKQPKPVNKDLQNKAQKVLDSINQYESQVAQGE